MKKVMLCSAIVVGVLVLGMSSVHAYWSHSGLTKGPDGKIGVTTHSSTHKLDCLEAPIKSSKVRVLFSYLGWLNSPDAVADSSRKMTVVLMDSDQFNKDDDLKYYEFKFNGLKISNVEMLDFTDKLVDESNDKTGEFYLNQTIDYRAGDVRESSHGEMYSYDIQVD